MTIPPLRRQVVVPAPPEAAFQAWTAEIGEWWPLAGHSVHGAGGSVSFVDGRLVETSAAGKTCDWGEVLAWDPPDFLSLTWHPGRGPERSGRVDVSFTPLGEGPLTLVTLEHHGWETYEDPRAAREQHGKGWPAVLGSYVDMVGAEAEPDGGGSYWLVLEHAAGVAAPQSGSVFASPLFSEHLRFLRRLAAEGVLVAAGSLPDDPGRGMTVVRVPDAKGVAATTLAAQYDDLSVAGGLFDVRVRPWRVALHG